MDNESEAGRFASQKEPPVVCPKLTRLAVYLKCRQWDPTTGTAHMDNESEAGRFASQKEPALTSEG